MSRETWRQSLGKSPDSWLTLCAQRVPASALVPDRSLNVSLAWDTHSYNWTQGWVSAKPWTPALAPVGIFLFLFPVQAFSQLRQKLPCLQGLVATALPS